MNLPWRQECDVVKTAVVKTIYPYHKYGSDKIENHLDEKRSFLALMTCESWVINLS